MTNGSVIIKVGRIGTQRKRIVQRLDPFILHFDLTLRHLSENINKKIKILELTSQSFLLLNKDKGTVIITAI